MKHGKDRKARDDVKTSIKIPRRVHQGVKRNCLNMTQAITASLLWFTDHPDRRDEINAYYEANCLD